MRIKMKKWKEKKIGGLCMDLNDIWCGGNSSGASLPLLPVPLWPGVVVYVRIPSMDPPNYELDSITKADVLLNKETKIHQWVNQICHIGLLPDIITVCKIKTFSETTKQKCKYKYSMMLLHTLK